MIVSEMILSTINFEKKKEAVTAYIFEFSSFKNTARSVGMVSTIGSKALK